MKVMRPAVVIACGAIAVAAGFSLRDNSYWLQVLTLVFILGIVAQSWNLLAGYAGQWSLAQTAFFGIGAYVSGGALLHWGVPLLAGLLLGAVVTAGLAFVIGALTLRIRGHYFALVTFLLTVALYGLARKFPGVTGGEYGLSIPIGEKTDLMRLQFEGSLGYYFLAVFVAAIATAIVYWVSHSRLGLLLQTIRDDEDAAQALGVRTLRLKVAAMMISAFMAALAGTVYLATFKLMDAETAFGISGSLDPVVAGILGGPGSLAGGLIGELILQPIIAEANTVFGGSSFGAPQLIYGAILMITILVFPRGVAGLARGIRTRYLDQRAAGRGAGKEASGPGAGAPTTARSEARTQDPAANTERLRG